MGYIMDCRFRFPLFLQKEGRNSQRERTHLSSFPPNPSGYFFFFLFGSNVFLSVCVLFFFLFFFKKKERKCDLFFS